jgi:proteic killer suppression protein
MPRPSAAIKRRDVAVFEAGSPERTAARACRGCGKAGATLAVERAALYLSRVIRSFRDKATKALFEGRPTAHLRRIAGVATRKLDMLDAAASLQDLRLPPGNRLEVLKGDRSGQHSIRINDRWRICFVWKDGAEDVEIVDYHR